MQKILSLGLKSLLLLAPLSLNSQVAMAAQEQVEAPEIALAELKQLVTSKSAVIVDVNGDESFKEGHIPGAINFSGQKAGLAGVLPKDKKTLIVAYCGGVMCTAWKKAATEAKKLGYTNIKHFKPGIKGWKDAGEAVAKGG